MLSPLLFNIKHKQLKQTKILENCSKLIAKGDLRIHVDTSMPLQYAAKAHEKIQKGNTMGKIVLEIK